MAQAGPQQRRIFAFVGITLSMVLTLAALSESRRINRRPTSHHPTQFDPRGYSTKLELTLALKVYKANGQVPREMKVLAVNQKSIDYYFTHERVGYLCTNSRDSLTDLGERPICTNLSSLEGVEDLKKGMIRRFHRNSNGSYNIILGQFALEQFTCKVFPGNQIVQSCTPWKQIKVVGH